MNTPFASIIVPVYNGERSISKCIESLVSQDYPTDKYEIIVVDNYSNDRTAEITQEYPVTYVFENRSQNSYAARNTGVKYSKGDALVFFDADQIATTSWLKKLLSQWDSEGYGAFGGREINRVPGFPLIEDSLLPNKDEPRKGSFILLSTACAAYRKNVFERLNGFDEAYASAGDNDLSIRLQKKLGLKIKYISDAVFYHMQPRYNLLSLMRRESRFGFGTSLLESKHPEIKRSIWIHTANPLSRTISGLGALFYGILKPINFKKKRERSIMILLDILLRWSYYYGVLSYHLGMERCGDLPKGTKSGKNQRIGMG